MTTILPVHIIGGVLALAGGYVALAAAKGSTLHRTSGRVFVGAMLVMALTGALVALATGSPISVVAGLLTFYFVTTGFLTVRRGRRDRQLLRSGAMDGSKRIARHLWRMCFAMWVAAASFFWGPRGRVPEVIRIPALQAFAVLLPVAVMAYWLWRLRGRRQRAHADSVLAMTVKEQVS